MNIQDIADRAAAYGVPGVIVDGTNALEVYSVSTHAVEKARHGGGPTLIEAKTHRRGGHAEGETAFLGGQEYRGEEEKMQAQEKDPLFILHRIILERRLAPESALEEIDENVTQAVEQAVMFARQSPYPAVESIYEDTWV
jgi:pyruvate dehydrogenase E1 component alpha subunit